MIYSIGNIKGGVGKSTVAANLAVALLLSERDVLVIDADEQQTLLTFTELRAEQTELPQYTAAALTGAAVRTQVRKLRDRFDDIVIDVGGRDSGSLRAALTVSDLLLIPTLPRSFDLWALDPLGELISEASEVNESLRAVSFLNMADPVGDDNRDAVAYLSEFTHANVIDAHLVRRKAYPNASAAGLSVLEYKPRDDKAIDEFSRLLNAIGVTYNGYR